MNSVNVNLYGYWINFVNLHNYTLTYICGLVLGKNL